MLRIPAALSVMLMLVVASLPAQGEETLAELLLRKETDPASVSAARARAHEAGLPVSLYLPEGVIVEVLAYKSGEPLYGVITNLAHPSSGGAVRTLGELRALYDLSRGRDLRRGPVVLHPGRQGARASADAGLLLVPDWTSDRVMAFDPATGNLVDTVFIPPTPSALSSPKEALASPRGTLLVSDQIQDAVQEFDTSGSFIGIFAPAGGVNTAILDNIRGQAYRPNGHLVVTVASGANAQALAEFDSAGNYLGNFIANGAGGLNSPFGILFRETDVLVTQSSTPTGVKKYDLEGAYVAQWASITSFPQQICRLPNGSIAVANFSGTGQMGVRLYRADGTFVRLLAGVTGNRGVALLGNGNFLTSNGAGIHEIDSTGGGLIRTILASGNLQYITPYLPDLDRVTVISPNGGEIWLSGATQNIRWTAAGAVDSVRVDYSTDGGAAWLPVTPPVPAAAGMLPWTVPSTPTVNALVRVAWAGDSSVTDVSDAPFTITATGLHDLGVVSLTLLSQATAGPPPSDGSADAAPGSGSSPGCGVAPGVAGDTARFRAVLRNFGTFTETAYALRWTVDGAPQAPVPAADSLPPGQEDTLTLVWTGDWGLHTARAWSELPGDYNPGNDSSAPLSFRIGRAPGDTLYTFIVPAQIILGVAKMGAPPKLAFTSGGQVAGTTTDDNRWIVTDLGGTVLDTTHLQQNPTAGQGFGFRDLAWDGRWLLTSDNAQMRRIDTTEFGEVLPPFTTLTNPNRGIGVQSPNRIWVSNFTSDPLRLYDTTGAVVRQLGVPPVAPYGIATDPWTTPGRMWLWYSEPSSTTGPRRLSRVDTAQGAVTLTYDYSSITPAGSVSGGLDIIHDHPDYPGRVVAFLVIQNFPSSKVIVVDLGPDSSTVTGMQAEPEPLPGGYALIGNYPNPFNPSTSINFQVPCESGMRLEVFDILGRRVALLASGLFPPGRHTLHWDGRAEDGSALGSGVYICRMEAQGTGGEPPFRAAWKMLLLR
ncbi:MAG: hypothetical protein WB626_07175 [Bacteroidota bacterium]